MLKRPNKNRHVTKDTMANLDLKVLSINFIQICCSRVSVLIIIVAIFG
ncbi:MAG: hypothetical protein IJS74_01675 [Clostridia bacterium]|nr:hypothetical protein [Clostridia bacterium]